MVSLTEGWKRGLVEYQGYQVKYKILGMSEDQVFVDDGHWS